MIGMTVCSGIGVPELAAPFIDWRYQSEIDPFARAVLKARFPHAINLGNMENFKEWPDHAIDILCGGTPCQSFSIAGLRKGLADPRGNLALVYLALLDRYAPEWCVWENVPGVLSSDGGRDFGTFLGGLAELGYGFAYRVLDAQFIRVESHPRAVPQRRRRVILVGHRGDWRRAASVLFEPQSLSGHSPPRREAGQSNTRDTAPSLVGSGRGARNSGDTRGQDPVIAVPEVGTPLTRRMHKGINTTMDEGQTMVAHTLRVEYDASEDGSGRGLPLVVAPTLRAGNNETGGNRPPGTDVDTLESLVPISFRNAGDGCSYEEGDVTAPLTTATDPNAQVLATRWAVRRLTPRECARLQGCPDDHCEITFRGKPATDSAQYKAYGNAMARNVMTWVLGRIWERRHA